MKLPKGLSINNGYLRIRVFHRGIVVEDTTLGQATPKAIDDAQIYLSRIREKIRANRLNMPVKEREMKFSDAAKLYFERWKDEKNENGQLKHTGLGVVNCKGIIEKQLVPFFGGYWFDSIAPKHVIDWRAKLLKRVGGTTANRYQAVLASIFSHIDKWSTLEVIEPIKRPTAPPTARVARAEIVSRDRLLSDYEFKKLKLAFRELGDFNGEQICKYAMATCLSEIDLRSIPRGLAFDSKRSKTKVRVMIPIPILETLDWTNWRKRWEAARAKAGLTDVEFRDLRKTGLNWADEANFERKRISQYAGHKKQSTTDIIYIKKQMELMRPIAEYLLKRVND